MNKRGTCALTPQIRKKICPTSKRAQMKLSFGMIFSIFLIIIFLAIAIYFIIKFLNLQESIQIETFQNNLQADINQMWQSQQGSREVEYRLPNKIDAICFIRNDDYQNLMFESEKPMDGKMIDNINLESITSGKTRYCIPNIDGKVKMTISKDYGETLVMIAKQN